MILVVAMLIYGFYQYRNLSDSERKEQKKIKNEIGQIAENLIDIEKGMYMGRGVDLEGQSGELENVYIPWGDLNSHFMCFGTTRQGKTRLLAFMMRQTIKKGDHVIFIEPKGAEEQEGMSWLYQYAFENESIKDTVYWSPEHPDMSLKINLLYGQSDEEATSTVIGAMKVDEEFFEDIANEILMTVLPALTFIEETIDELFLEIMERIEYNKAMIINPINRLNKRMLGSYFNPDLHDVEDNILQFMLSHHDGDTLMQKRINEQYLKVTSESKKSNPTPIRKFVTFADLARYANLSDIQKLKEEVQAALQSHKMSLSREKYHEGEMALANLTKLSEEDSGFFSKVTKSYSVTMSRLSTGNVGKLLCDSKVNILKDMFYEKGRRVIMAVQPFPMKYEKAANMSIKMLMSMMNNLMSNVGVSGKMGENRIHVFIDEAGSVANSQMLSLINKGGGLGLSLYMYSQSFADYKDTLGEEGATIMADNANNKGFFLVNDNDSAETISGIIGSQKKGDITYGSSEGTTSRTQGKAVAEELVPASLVMRLQKMTYVLKTGSRVFMMAAPFQRDPMIELSFPYTDFIGKSETSKQFMQDHIKYTQTT